MTMTHPVVTVIVPSYNHGAFLPATLDSIHEQTWPQIEVIVIDDGSTDDTLNILEPWRQRGVRVVQQAHLGASAARNRGIELASGEFIAFLDSDDLWPRTDMIEAALALLATHPDIGWTFGDAQPFAQHGDELRLIDTPYLQAGGYYHTPALTAERCSVTPGDLCNNDQFFIPTGTLLIRKRCFDEVGGFDAGLRMFEDTDMWMRLLRYPVAFFPSVLLLRRVYAENISHRRWAHLEDLKTIFERYDLAAHGVSFDFHAARAHYGTGREAWRQGQFAKAAQDFANALRHHWTWKAALLHSAATLAAVLKPGRAR